MASLNPAQLEGLKRVIDSHLRKTNVYSEVRSFISEHLRSAGDQDEVRCCRRQAVPELATSDFQNEALPTQCNSQLGSSTIHFRLYLSPFRAPSLEL